MIPPLAHWSHTHTKERESQGSMMGWASATQPRITLKMLEKKNPYRLRVAGLGRLGGRFISLC